MHLELINNIKYEPEIRAYWFWAVQLLILKNSDIHTNWLANNFINIIYDK